MKTAYSKAFEKDFRSLPAGVHMQVLTLVDKVKAAAQLCDMPDCIPLRGSRSKYRIRCGSYRVIFTLEQDNTVFLHRIVPRGQAYKKHNL
ncbi:MAG: type II toxin-antitoxin system RelE/ParE family toxin [Prevotellaceae bacterium]|jgi:mRNA-degrading endonuclease RelE of RelBE toxin-antitoxin system|nr:type II toxin-antitoxin system RelE/ParE family toxin [Prevotellaceae bacterium]